MKKQNGIIKLCLLMAFVSYFIWNQNEKKLSQPQVDEHITSIINQVKSINQKEKINTFTIPMEIDETNNSYPFILINNNDYLIRF